MLNTKTKRQLSPRTIRKTQPARVGRRTANQELDAVYILKLLLYLLAGSFWVKVAKNGEVHIVLPVGLALGVIFASHERFRIDRKIEYAILLMAMLVGYFVPYGLYINL
jgi:hypothetical protein